MGVISLAPAFLSSRGSTAALAVGVGGLLLGYHAMRRLVVGLSHLAGAAISWKQVSLLFHAARKTSEPGVTLSAADAKPSETVLELRNVSFHHANRPEPVLRSVGLQVKEGDRLLLESGSGSGKSSLVSIIAGLRRPQSGLLLTGGLDQATLGPRAWRKKVAVAPQYQENHVLTAPLAFNLLMGRHWPPRPQDLEEAESVCRELELGPLLDRMPGGLQQMVGESGWQLSSGEKSRLYMARALLQWSDVVVLDESFAALDPQTLERCLECVWKRARTLMVVAHP